MKPTLHLFAQHETVKGPFNGIDNICIALTFPGKAIHITILGIFEIYRVQKHVGRCYAQIVNKTSNSLEQSSSCILVLSAGENNQCRQKSRKRCGPLATSRSFNFNVNDLRSFAMLFKQ